MIVCKSPSELDRMYAASQVVAQVLEALRPLAVAGATTADIDREAEKLVRAAGAVPAFKGYRGFPGTVCASLNDAVIHGIPSASRRLREGDILSLDMGVKLNGYYGDSAITVPIGEITPEAQRLLQVTQAALVEGIAAVKVGGRVSDIGHAIQKLVEAHGYSVVREFVGHGIGTQLHEEPQVPNYGPAGRGPRLAEGMTLAIEPMVNAGKAAVKVLSDGWTAVTVDGSLSAHFEHTVAVRSSGGPWILTGLPAGQGEGASARSGARSESGARASA